MATFKVHESFVYAAEAGANLTASLNLFMTLDNSGNVILQSNAGLPVLGTLFEVPLASTVPYGPATVQFAGIAKIILGGTVNAGAQVMSDGSGKAVVLTAGLSRAGLALVGGVSGDVIPVMLG